MHHSHFLIVVRILALIYFATHGYQTMLRVLVSVVWIIWTAFPVTILYLVTSANWAFGSV